MAGVAGAGAGAAELPVLLLIDSAGCDMEEQAEEEGDSKVRWLSLRLSLAALRWHRAV